MKISRSILELLPFITALFSLTSCSHVNSPEPLNNSPIIEERGIWLHRKDILAPKEDLLKLLDELKEANFTSLYVQTYFRGSVIYPDSRFLPQFSEVEDPDILDWLIPEIRKRGMRAEAWMEYGFYVCHVPDATKTDDRGFFLSLYPELTARDADGISYIHNEDWGDYYSLCPANPKSHELLANVCLETLTLYPFDGLNLDRIRFPGERFCFCDFCKINFKKDTGLDLEPFPIDSLEYKIFIRWRNDKISRFMEVYVPRFRHARPGVTVTMACLPPDMMESHSQPWNLWLEKGYLDAAMPMLYGDDDFENRVRIIMAFPRRDLIFCALDADDLKPRKILKQIKRLKRKGIKGFAFWYSGAIKNDLPRLKSGPFAIPAFSPLD